MCYVDLLYDFANKLVIKAKIQKHFGEHNCFKFQLVMQKPIFAFFSETLVVLYEVVNIELRESISISIFNANM